MSIQVIDDLLPQEEFKIIHDLFLGDENSRKIRWGVYQKNGIETEDLVNFQDTTDLYNYHFAHMFYHQTKFVTDENFKMLLPIVHRMNASALLKVKANLQPATPSIIVHPFHTDMGPKFGGKTAVYYVNTNNGFTLTEDGHKIDSIANRVFIFDSQLKHAASTCTDKRFRCVINFNFYTWEK